MTNKIQGKNSLKLKIISFNINSLISNFKRMSLLKLINTNKSDLVL